MNPHVSLNWMEVAFPFIMTVVVGIQLYRRGPFRQEFLGRIGLAAIILAFAGTSVANLFYQRVVHVRAWPTVGIFDQVVVTPAGDVYVKIKEPMMGRADRVQRYSCRGEFKAAFQPDNAGGLFKIVANPDYTLSIYNVRTDSIEIYDRDGTFLQRHEVDSQNMPFDFLKTGPSVTKASDCEFVTDPISRRPAVKDSTGVWPLERGDWVLQYVLSRQNIAGAALLGILLLVISYVRMRNRGAAGWAA